MFVQSHTQYSWNRPTASIFSAENQIAKITKCTAEIGLLPPMKNRSGTNAYPKNRSNELVHLKKKNDHLLILYIAVDRFLKRTLSLDWFLKHSLSLNRFYIGGIVLFCLHSSSFMSALLEYLQLLQIYYTKSSQSWHHGLKIPTLKREAMNVFYCRRLLVIPRLFFPKTSTHFVASIDPTEVSRPMSAQPNENNPDR